MSALAAVETLRERRLTRNRRNPGLGLRGGADAFTSPAEEAAMRLAQADRDRQLVAEALLQEDEDAKRIAAEAKTAPARLKQAAEGYVAARRHVEVALAGAIIRVQPGTENIEVVGLLEALEALVPARRAYDAAWSIAEKYGVLGDHHRIEHLAVARDLHKLMALAASA